MAYETFSELLGLVKGWSNRRDLTDENFYNFIFFAGNMANQLLRVPAMENTLVLDVSVDGQVVIPYDFMELRSLTANFGSTDSVPLERIAWDQFINYYNDDSNPNNTQPLYFARQGAFWFLTPNPGDTVKVTCHYYRAMPDINIDEPTNWLTELSPMTYVFGALHYLYLYLMDDDRAQYWLVKFQDEISRIQAVSDKAEYSGSSLSVKFRTPEGIS